jgi:N-glycosylase/DNA lyase
MSEQTYILKNPESFNLKHIFECGQCFRWNEEADGSYIGVIKSGVINVRQSGKDFIFEAEVDGNLENIVKDYFDLNTSYSKIKEELSKIDEYMKASIEFGDGIRILNQDLWECIISFIISANNNIPRIKKIIEKISSTYGKKIIFKNKEYFLFPTVEELSKASVEDLRKMGLGFRDKRVFTTTKMIKENVVSLKVLEESDNSKYIEEELLKLDGVGPKVANCIMLFSLRRFDVFPIDVWVRRVMNDLYIHNEVEEKVSKKEIEKLAKEKFLELPGIAQQYLFYWKREQGKGA